MGPTDGLSISTLAEDLKHCKPFVQEQHKSLLPLPSKSKSNKIDRYCPDTASSCRFGLLFGIASSIPRERSCVNAHGSSVLLLLLFFSGKAQSEKRNGPQAGTICRLPMETIGRIENQKS